MGKKARKEREEKRENFAAKRTKQKRKNTLIAVAIFAGVAAIVGIQAYNFATSTASAPGAPAGAGVLGDDHSHTSILVRIFGDKFDFSSPSYQIKSSWIHFEGQDGNTIHRHSTGVTMGFLFESLGLGLDAQCFIFQDERAFCTNDEYSLKFYINHDEVLDIRDYVGQEGDRVLISYGSDSPESIENQLSELDAQLIVK